MNDKPKTTPAFVEARALKVSSKKVIWFSAFFGLLAVILIMAIFGYMAAHFELYLGSGLTPWMVVAVLLLAMMPTLWWGVVYWKSIDEMAKRAHLDAFFWGGGNIAWALFLPFIVPMLTLPNFKIMAIEANSTSYTHAFGVGASAAIGATLLGYAVFWLIWWAKKR